MFATDPVRRTRVGTGLVADRPDRIGRRRRFLTQITTLCTLGLLAASSHAGLATVPGTSNIFGAGHAIAPDPGSYGPGTLPTMLDLFAAPARTITFDTVTGSVSCKPVLGWNGPDGGPYATGNTDILSFGGISGIIHAHATMFLVGVFTDGSEPSGPGPARLDVSSLTTSASFHPLLFQTFFIGDGKTGTGAGAVQVFHVPGGAVKLFLGFADAYGFGNPVDLPGSYSDNAGEFRVSYTLIPSPGALALAICGTVLLARRTHR